MLEADPHRIVADAKGRFQFLERGVGLFSDVGLEFGWIEFAPGTPARFGGQGVGFGGGEVAVDRALGEAEAPRGLRLGAARFNKLHHPFPQIQRVGFHAHTLSVYLPM